MSMRTDNIEPMARAICERQLRRFAASETGTVAAIGDCDGSRSGRWIELGDQLGVVLGHLGIGVAAVLVQEVD